MKDVKMIGLYSVKKKMKREEGRKERRKRKIVKETEIKRKMKCQMMGQHKLKEDKENIEGINEGKMDNI